MKQRNFRNYQVWKDAMNLVSSIYLMTQSFPNHETYGLASQMQRAAISIPSNIAEGSAKPNDSDFARFLDIALGSSYELETQITIAHNINYIDEGTQDQMIFRIINIQKQLTLFIGKIRSN